MSDAILVAIITGGLSLLGIIYSSGKSASKVDAKLDKQQAVIETKLNELTREVREHNNFARRVPVVEEQIMVSCKYIAEAFTKFKAILDATKEDKSYDEVK